MPPLGEQTTARPRARRPSRTALVWRRVKIADVEQRHAANLLVRRRVMAVMRLKGSIDLQLYSARGSLMQCGQCLFQKVHGPNAFLTGKPLITFGHTVDQHLED